MKKFLIVAGLAGALFAAVSTPQEAEAGDDDTASIVLSTIFPGAGEWYNAGFQGGFPLVECILGNICVCVRWASMIDAAAGRTDDGIRFDFWSSPV